MNPEERVGARIGCLTRWSNSLLNIKNNWSGRMLFNL
jgi:hypothetical protein